jgi:hypothetical protein
MLSRIGIPCAIGLILVGTLSVSPAKIAPSPMPLPAMVGVVFWADDPPPPPTNLPLAGVPSAVDCKLPILDESIVVDPESKGLRDVFVWLEPAPGKKFEIPASLQEPAAATVEIDQVNCTYVPHVVALREGQTLTVKNSSKVAHNFKWQGVNAQGGKLQPPGPSCVIEGLKADRLPISIECNIHPWMKGYVRVYDHPYYAVTDSKGKFSIPAPTAGPCVLKIWHGSKGWIGGAVGRAGRPIVATGTAQDLGKIAY